MKKKAIVIGSGVAGLAIAIRLAKSNYEVSLFEKENHVGGKVSWIEQANFKWGLGASLLTFPEFIDELFQLCDKDPKQYYTYHALNPITKYFFTDDTIINAYADKKLFAQEIENNTHDKAKTVLEYLEKIEHLYTRTASTFLYRSLHRIKTYLTQNAIRVFTTSPFKLGIFSSIHKKNATTFRDKNTIQLFDRYATYNGSNPFKAPAILNVIAHPEFNEGAYMLHDGMPSLTQNMEKLAKEMGVSIHLNSKVNRILVEKNKAIGISTTTANHYADVVVSNMDIQFTYTQLLPNIKSPKRYLQQEKSTSALIFYWGLNKTFSDLDVHNILFSDDYTKEFECINKSTIYEAPTIYIFISSKINPSHAIPNGENWFVLINVPHHNGQEWNAIVEKFRPIIIHKINQKLKQDIQPHIVTEYINHPQTIALQTFSYLGALYGNSSNKMMSSFLRHPNFSSKVKNLYFCGGSVHPGGGVPISLLSAKITHELIQEDQ